MWPVAGDAADQIDAAIEAEAAADALVDSVVEGPNGAFGGEATLPIEVEPEPGGSAAGVDDLLSDAVEADAASLLTEALVESDVAADWAEGEFDADAVGSRTGVSALDAIDGEPGDAAADADDLLSDAVDADAASILSGALVRPDVSGASTLGAAEADAANVLDALFEPDSDIRLADPRVADPRLADGRLADARLADARLADAPNVLGDEWTELDAGLDVEDPAIGFVVGEGRRLIGRDRRDGLDRRPPSALTEREQAMLRFERFWWRQAGSKEQAIRETFDLSSTHYYRLLNALLEVPAAAEFDAIVVGRLRRLRASRAWRRSGR
ncbi:MAG TPA: DUF3263 domain-containing protein [Micromonosporaceae bacterium]|jgi:hypothetical protein|nr:DUF3263 domain-containing protein [Micromonosporaceae bacterium]